MRARGSPTCPAACCWRAWCGQSGWGATRSSQPTRSSCCGAGARSWRRPAPRASSAWRPTRSPRCNARWRGTAWTRCRACRRSRAAPPATSATSSASTWRRCRRRATTTSRSRTCASASTTGSWPGITRAAARGSSRTACPDRPRAPGPCGSACRLRARAAGVGIVAGRPHGGAGRGGARGRAAARRGRCRASPASRRRSPATRTWPRSPAHGSTSSRATSSR